MWDVTLLRACEGQKWVLASSFQFFPLPCPSSLCPPVCLFFCHFFVSVWKVYPAFGGGAGELNWTCNEIKRINCLVYFQQFQNETLPYLNLDPYFITTFQSIWIETPLSHFDWFVIMHRGGGEFSLNKSQSGTFAHLFKVRFTDELTQINLFRGFNFWKLNKLFDCDVSNGVLDPNTKSTVLVLDGKWSQCWVVVVQCGH